MARVKLSEEELLKRKMARREKRKALRKANKIALKAEKNKSSTKRIKGNTDGVIEVDANDKEKTKEMIKLISEGKARRYGWNMGTIMYIMNE